MGTTCVHSPRHPSRRPAADHRIPLAPTPSGDDRTSQRLTNRPLNAFGTREGHLRVPQAHLEDGYPLGVKVSITRRDHRRGKLSADRVNVLKAMPGWTWQSGRQVNIGRPDGLW
ncbi:helicase associated domain-containing protein [Streptomyces sp. NPDC056653]|uniref:helicase associated domain-containing protein n=1 Tax=Streptomyces sp. NPDC056653 TaxID=3345894 RepID=UPI003686AAB4